MKTLDTHIDIAAPPDVVWAVLTDFPSFGRWNPFIVHIAGTVVEGQRLEARLQPPGGRAMTFRPTLRVVRQERELRWLGRLALPGLFDGEHIFLVEPTETGVRFTQREEFRGVLVPLLWRQLDTKTRAGFEAMNEALKLRAEAATGN